MRIDSAQPMPGGGDATPVRTGRETAGVASPVPDPVAVQAAVDKLNKALPDDLRASFQMDPDTHIMVVQLIDSQTGEVKRQFPPEWVISTAEHIDKALGVLLDHKA